MTLVRNAVPPETAALIRARIAGKPLPPAIAKAPKEPGKPKCMCSQFHRYNPENNSHLVQLPIFLAQPKRFVPPRKMTGAQIKWRLKCEAEEYEELRDGITADIQRYMPNGIRGLQRIEYVRLSSRAGSSNEMDDDNLAACFKVVRDAVCIYARWGSEWLRHKDAIGHADGYLKQQGVKWTYRQQKCSANPRLHGIQIVLHCAPRMTEQ